MASAVIASSVVISKTPLPNNQKKKTYDVIMIDPPWSYFGSTTKNAAAGKHYSLMSQEELAKIELKSLLKKKGMVFVWATCPRLNFAIEMIKSWGLNYRGVAFVWVKTRKDGGIISGQGVPPTFTKPTTELLLLATTNKTGRPVPLRKFNTAQVILSPRGAHSVKPAVFRTTIEETLVTGIDKLEIFGRQVVPGWDVIGDGITGEDVTVSISKLNGTFVDPAAVLQDEAESKNFSSTK